MGKWESITIYPQQIKARSERFFMIAMPHKGDYNGYVFWHPAKLVRERGREYTFSFTDEFTFRLKKYGNGKYNSRELLDEIELSAADIREEFLKKEDFFVDGIDYEPEIYTPEPLEPEHAEADESLVDYE